MAVIAPILFAASAKPARAGYWTVDHCEFVLDRSGTSFHPDANGQPTSDPIYDEKYGDENRPHIAGKLNHNRLEFYGTFLDYNGPNLTHGAGTGKAKLTVTAFYRWHGDEPIPEFIYSKERLKVYVGLEHCLNWDAPSFNSHPQYQPYKGEGFSITRAIDGFGLREPDDAGHVNPFSGGYGSGTDLQARGFWFYPDHLGVIESKGRTLVPGITRTMDFEVAAPGGWALGHNQYAMAWYNMEYVAEFAGFDVKVRRKGTTQPFASEATIAPGHVDRDEHAAEVEVQSNIQRLKRDEFPPLRFRPTTERGKNLPAEFEEYEGLNAEADDSGKLIAKVVRSRDKISEYGQNVPLEHGPVIVEFDLGKNNVSPYATLHHGMVTRWYMGENGNYNMNIALIPGRSVPVVVKADMPDYGPVGGHTFRFFPVRLVVTEWEDASHISTVTRTYLLDDPDMNIPDEEGAIRLSRSQMKKYIEMGDGSLDYVDVLGDGDGIHKFYVKPTKDSGWLVEDVKLGLKDLGVFLRKTP